MSRLVGIDLETTGLDIKKDRALKIGAILYEGSHCLVEKEWTLWCDDYPEIKPDALLAHSIRREDCVEFGEHPREALMELTKLIENHRIDYLIAHNGQSFDFPMILTMCEAYNIACGSLFRRIPKIDTSIDLPFPENITTRKLSYLAAEHGFINPFPHSALSDIRTMMEVLSYYPLDLVIDRSKSEMMTIRAKVGFESKELAKARRYHWDTQSQRWLKKIKACDLNKELQRAAFEIAEVRE